MAGILLRIILLTFDYFHMLAAGKHFINTQYEEFTRKVKLEVFIKAPETLFEFPLFAISLDWLELAIVLKSTNNITTESYLKTHRKLQCIFYIMASFIVAICIVDVVISTLSPYSWMNFPMYKGPVDCIQSLITASFSTIVLTLFICAYISLVSSIR